MNVNLLRGRLLFLALACMALPGCEGDSSNDEPAPIVTPVPGPEPEPRPTPTSGWVPQDGGSELDLNVVSAGDSSHVCTAESNVNTPGGFIQGVLRRTLDGGSTWTSLGPIPENQSAGALGGLFPSVLQMQFLDELTGWALTRFSVLSTSDGGLTWVTHWNSLVSHLSVMSFISTTTGWIATENYGGIMKTTDGGETWTHHGIVDGYNEAGRAMKFIDELTGWIAIRNGSSPGEEIYKTTDGGITWQLQLFIAGEYDALRIRDIAAVGPDRVWVVGGSDQDEVMMASTDGGATWTQQQSDGSSGIRAVHFVDANLGWAVGRKIHHTTDGGATWTVQPTPQEWFRDVVFVNATTGWVVGEGGLILKTTTGGAE